MSKALEDLQELLTYGDAQAPWFALNEQMPHALVKRNLKLLRGLNGSSTTLEELNLLTEEEIKKAISEYRARMQQSPPVAQLPTTTAQYFHSIIEKSPYFSEIIAYSGRSTPLYVSVKTNADDAPIKKSDSVHGFHLNEQEAFSSIRYFSADKTSYAQVIAKDGVFEGSAQNLNSNQKTDLAFEICFQFLLNMPPENKTITIEGSPEMVHRVHAACLYLQKEAGPRYADLKFKLPEGVSIAPGELNNEYINKHLGVLNETPPQVVQLHDFLKMATNSPAEPAPTPNPTEREALESGADSIKDLIKEHLRQEEVGLAEELTLLKHVENMQEIKELIKDKEELPAELMRSCGAQMVQALNFLEGLKDYSKSPIFKDMKDYSNELAETKEKAIKTTPQQIMQGMKEQLNQLKKDKVPEVLLDTITKDKLKGLTKNAEVLIKSMEELPLKQHTTLIQYLNIRNLLTQFETMSNSPEISLVQSQELLQSIDSVLPDIQDDAFMVKSVLSKIKTLIEAPPVVDDLSQDSNIAPQPSM